MLLRLLLLCLLLPVSCFGPGFFFVRRFRWDPLETLTASIALSLMIVYLLTFGAYWLSLEVWANITITLICVTLTAAAWRDARRLLRSARLRRVLIWFGALVVWTVGAQLLVRHYSGGDWCCDWLEHYQRTLNFVTDKPNGFLYIHRYLLTARPPMMNVLVAQFLEQTGTQFALYQVAMSVLNLLVFFPCCLVARLFARRGLRHVGLVAVVLAANPMFFENTTFPWTKALTAMFVVLATWFYIVGWRRDDAVRMGAAFLALAAACTVHYSAGPYAVFLGLHYLVVVLPTRRSRVRRLAGVVAPGAAFGSVWFVWAIGEFGAFKTFLSNSTVAGTGHLGLAANLVKVALNIRDSLLPHLWAGRPDHTALRHLTDRAFMLYQVNVLLALGSVGCVVALWLLARALRPGARILPRSERLFWTAFIIFVLVVGIAVHGERDPFGLAQICLQAMLYMGVTLVAATLLSQPRWVRICLWCGLLADFVFGVALEIYMEHALQPWARSHNWDLKLEAHTTYLGDLMRPHAAVVAAVMVVLAVTAFGWMARVLMRQPSPAAVTR